MNKTILQSKEGKYYKSRAYPEFHFQIFGKEDQANFSPKFEDIFTLKLNLSTEGVFTR